MDYELVDIAGPRVLDSEVVGIEVRVLNKKLLQHLGPTDGNRGWQGLRARVEWEGVRQPIANWCCAGWDGGDGGGGDKQQACGYCSPELRALGLLRICATQKQHLIPSVDGPGLGRRKPRQGMSNQSVGQPLGGLLFPLSAHLQTREHVPRTVLPRQPRAKPLSLRIAPR